MVDVFHLPSAEGAEIAPPVNLRSSRTFAWPRRSARRIPIVDRSNGRSLHAKGTPGSFPTRDLMRDRWRTHGELHRYWQQMVGAVVADDAYIR